MMIMKARSGTWAGDTGWLVYHKDLGTGSDCAYYMSLNTTNAKSGSCYSGYWGGATTATNFPIGTDVWAGHNGTTYINYCFHSVDGYSKVGSYTGNGSTDGPFVYCGFRPAFVLIRCATSAEEWWMFDAKRDPDNLVHHALRPSGSSAESSGTAAGSEHMDFTSNGFKITARGGSVNGNTGGTYIFYAIAENPFKYTNAR